MVRKSARPSQSSRQRGRKSATSGNSAPVSAKALKIGEAARLLGVEAYVLRFWETQFPDLRPYHTATRHRLYNPEDIETLRLIKHLLYEEGFTIEGARKRIRELMRGQGHAKAAAARSTGKTSVANASAAGAQSSPASGAAARQALIEIRRDLESLYQLLKD